MYLGWGSKFIWLMISCFHLFRFTEYRLPNLTSTIQYFWGSANHQPAMFLNVAEICIDGVDRCYFVCFPNMPSKCGRMTVFRCSKLLLIIITSLAGVGTAIVICFLDIATMHHRTQMIIEYRKVSQESIIASGKPPIRSEAAMTYK